MSTDDPNGYGRAIEAIRADERAKVEAWVREHIAEQVTTLAPDKSGRISKGLALAYILGELDGDT